MIDKKVFLRYRFHPKMFEDLSVLNLVLVQVPAVLN